MIVDDEPLAVQMLENFVERTPFLNNCGSFNDPILALEAIRANKPQLLFLDIQMPDLSGMELSRLLPEGTAVIFTTAFREYAVESYEVAAAGYLLKPIRYQKFLEASQRVLEQIKMREAACGAQATSPQKSIFIKTDGNLRRVELSDILYISGMKDYVCVRLASQKSPLVTHITMKTMEEMLPSDSFMRVHKSHIVALQKIESVSSSLDIEIGGVLVHVGNQYAPAFRAWLEGRAIADR